MPEGLPEEKLNIAATFAVSANLGIMRDWVVESMETPLETIYESVDELLKTVLSPPILEVIETETGLK